MTPVEKYIYNLIEEWVQNQSWDCEESVSIAISETNSIFDWMDYDSIKISEVDNSNFSFNAKIIFTGEPRKKDVMFCGDTIDIYVEGEVEFNGETAEWEILDDHDVRAAVREWRDDEDSYLEDAPASSENIINQLSNIQRGKWFRGHSDADWPLITSIGRIDEPDLSKEQELLREFERRIAFLDQITHPMPLADLTFLMQHHGIPTRLLDWTTNPLVALYFALSDETKKEKDACIWIMDPRQLNRSFKEDYPAEIEEVIFTGKDEKKVVAICAAHSNTRMNSQRSEFTIHLNYTPLDRIKEASVALSERIMIPSRLKAELKEKLRSLGVDRSSLFPDLDNIARTVVEDVLGS